MTAWLGPATQQFRRWIPRLRRAFGIKRHISTLHRYARAAGYAWKRCRRSLRAQRGDPDAFAACHARLGERHQAEARSELAVVYVDECRFSRQVPVSYAWQRRGQPTVLVPDNASIHQAHLVRACHAEWAAKGLTLLFLPPYSPELNRIELLWHRCKHYWVRPEDYQTEQTLLERIEYVLKRVGSDYTITFA